MMSIPPIDKEHHCSKRFPVATSRVLVEDSALQLKAKELSELADRTKREFQIARANMEKMKMDGNFTQEQLDIANLDVRQKLEKAFVAAKMNKSAVFFDAEAPSPTTE